VIMNVVTFTWATWVTEPDIAALVEELAALPGQVPALSSYRFGSNVGLRPGGGDFAIVAVVPDRTSFATYVDDPSHVRVAGRLRHMASAWTAVQIEVVD